jgi:(p)ppGpp synthase/HD superfamily hydrolase
VNLVARAQLWAVRAHHGQFRKFSGQPYVEHPKRVAQIILRYKESANLDTLLAAALLHDTLEDTSTTTEDLFYEFGPEVTNLVVELSTPEEVTKDDKKKYLAQKMSGMTSYALVIKLADRLENCSDLRHTNKEFRRSYVKETKYIISEIIATRSFLSNTHLDLIHDILKEVNVASRLDSYME